MSANTSLDKEPELTPIDCLTQEIENLKLIQASQEDDRKKDLIPSLSDIPWTKHELKTGLIYDDFMAKHECLWVKSDECPERYHAVKGRISQLGLDDNCLKLESKVATEEDVLLLHDKEYYDIIKSTQGEKDIDKLKKISEKYDAVYFNEYTYDCAMMALGSSLHLADEILDGKKIRNGFGVIRTPGHHAQRDEANGFCYFNNAAIVARHCIQRRNTKRVLIIDWDIHHGQGTQSFFYDDPNVLYISIHRYEKGKFWPELIESNFNFTGSGPGKGYNINFPLNETGCNDADFLLIWFNVILPVVYEFNPELVVISAGFDAAIGCPEGKMRVKPTTYYSLCQSLMSVAGGKVLALLEGGYNLASLAESAAMTLRALLGYPAPKIDSNFVELQPHQSVCQTILSVIWALRPQWKLLRLQGQYERFKPESCTSAGGDQDSRPKFSPVATFDGDISASKPAVYDLTLVCCPKDTEEQARLAVEIETIIKNTTPDDIGRESLLRGGSSRTLLIYDDTMTLHVSKRPHPENPYRYTNIRGRIEGAGLASRCTIGKSRPATSEELQLVHSAEYIQALESISKKSFKHLTSNEARFIGDSIYGNKNTYQCALMAAGCTLEAIDKVMSGESLNAFAIVRPPGHHAHRDQASGFCFFNNVALGAKYALDKYSDTCKRVLIVDYDFHHGNGTQAMLKDDDRCLYISLHGYNDAYHYPNESSSNYNTGTKNIVNIPWNDDIMGDAEYMLAYFSILLPAAYEFNPDLVLVSSGFDAAVKDPVGSYQVSPEAYGHFVHHLLPLASGRLVASLEGGYNLDSISWGAAYVVSVLLGDPPRPLSLDAPSPSAIISMKNVISYHKSDYKLLCLDYDLPSDEVTD